MEHISGIYLGFMIVDILLVFSTRGQREREREREKGGAWLAKKTALGKGPTYQANSVSFVNQF